MAYIGRAPNQGVRSRFVYQATASQTTFSGSDANSLTLSYSDSLYMDVYQNGVLLKAGTDYTATSGTSVVLVTGASLNDIVEMIVYDAFTVADSYTKTEADTRYPFKGNNSIIRLNGQTITADITIDSDENGVSGGPITQSATVTVNGGVAVAATVSIGGTGYAFGDSLTVDYADTGNFGKNLILSIPNTVGVISAFNSLIIDRVQGNIAVDASSTLFYVGL